MIQLKKAVKTVEVTQVIKNMSDNKSLGSDGLPVEFYKFFGKDLGDILLQSLNNGYEIGHLSITQRQGIITSLPKPRKPREFLKNWRPITLLTVDYKKLSGVLALSMKNVFGDLFSSDQKGFLKGHYIGETTRLVYDVMSYLKEQDKNGMLFVIDFEKAFDTLSWKCILQVLESYGFGQSFRKWYKMINIKTDSDFSTSPVATETAITPGRLPASQCFGECTPGAEKIHLQPSRLIPLTENEFHPVRS